MLISLLKLAKTMCHPDALANSMKMAKPLKMYQVVVDSNDDNICIL